MLEIPLKIIRHQGWQVLKVVSPDEMLLAQVHQENSRPEITKQAGCARKQLGTMYRLRVIVQGQGGIIVDLSCKMG